jgi:NADH-quinone oxidoreductase subunit M
MLTISLILLPIIAGLITLTTKGDNAKIIASIFAFAEMILGAYVYYSFAPNATFGRYKILSWY